MLSHRVLLAKMNDDTYRLLVHADMEQRGTLEKKFAALYESAFQYYSSCDCENCDHVVEQLKCVTEDATTINDVNYAVCNVEKLFDILSAEDTFDSLAHNDGKSMPSRFGYMHFMPNIWVIHFSEFYQEYQHYVKMSDRRGVVVL